MRNRRYYIKLPPHKKSIDDLIPFVILTDSKGQYLPYCKYHHGIPSKNPESKHYYKKCESKKCKDYRKSRSNDYCIIDLNGRNGCK